MQADSKSNDQETELNSDPHPTEKNSHATIAQIHFLLELPMPTFVATLPAPDCPPHPKNLCAIFRAKISPNPSMTPLTNGRSRLIERLEKKAMTRERVESLLSNIASVAEGGGGALGAAAEAERACCFLPW